MNGKKMSEPITLQVGEGRYHTTAGTLIERSDYFKAYFSGKWTIPKMDDGSIFIDGDSSSFEHVLKYLRRGVFPLAFDAAKGHDYQLYAAVLEEAKYFQCPQLVTWLEDKCYRKCITWHDSTEPFEERMSSSRGDSSVGDWSLLPCGTTEKMTYICPRGIGLHRGNPQECGRQCRNAQGDDDPKYDLEKFTSEWLVSKTTYVFNSGWMTDSGDSFLEHVQTKYSGGGRLIGRPLGATMN
ncbi:uncharacterized protein GIQ15_03600 [Arthroderma uncinatum]|uniref:uncharacterized protein n=1 Tax=Arthroderma uncinatum TaxID=74035 RepID=UPI00144A6FAD|nr:uncharacterized protein GIQ15_03600 [Arthroderma uncinatum]KAF3484276.1 hypothetical protein GIQ15_03600 [Arthroderma uncinatum]